MGNRGRPKPPRDDAASIKAAKSIRAKPALMQQLARDLDLTVQAIRHWRVVPLERVVDVERSTGIPRHQLRPDFHLPIAQEA
jgi:DNA-binding transcriptional regulator YdaS (Cro superfamily)